MLSQSPSRFILSIAVAVAAGASAQDAIPSPVSTDVAALKQVLSDSTTRQDQRDQAAQRLLSRPDPSARAAIIDALKLLGQPATQLAAARALADRPTADANLVNPLFALLDANSSEPLIVAAGNALTAFKENDEVLTRLLGLARDGNDERIRIAAIRALGTFVDQRVGQTLIDMLDPSNQSAAVNAEAARSLSYLSGLDAAQMTTDGWRKWWEANRNKTQSQFQAAVAPAREAQYDRVRAAVVDLKNEFQRLLSDQYQRLPADQRADALVRFLRSPESAVRVVGCQIAAQATTRGEVPPPAVDEQLRQLVGDSSPDVRRESAKALALINDPSALTPLLTQLGQETDPSARAALIDALRPIGDVRATPVLLAMLDDPSLDVVQSAAEALGDREFGQKLRQSNPGLAEDAARKLMQTLKSRTGPLQNQTIELRYQLVQAMIPLQSRAQAPELVRMLSSAVEDRKVRRAILSALGDMRDPQMADAIATMLKDDDTGVRLAAVKALGDVADSFGAYEKQLSDRIDPAQEKSQDVRDAAWVVLTNLFPKAPANQLPQWVLKLKNDPVKLLVVLKEERARARAVGDEGGVASWNQQIGETSRDAGLWSDAIAAYSDALVYATQNNKQYMIEVLSEGMTKAYLAQRQYEQATNFVQKQIRSDPSLEGTLGSDLTSEAERLVTDNKDYEASRQLIDLSLKISPQLKPQFTQRLNDLNKLVDKRSHEQNLTPNPARERLQNA